MKKIVTLVFCVLMCTNNIYCAPKKINRASEFLKGTAALTAATALAYLAYKAPIDTIKSKSMQLWQHITQPTSLEKIKTSLSNNANSCVTFLKKFTFGKEIDQAKIFSLLIIIPAYELTKYSICKLANSIQSNKEMERRKRPKS